MSRNTQIKSLLWALVLLGIGGLLVVGLWQTAGTNPVQVGYRRELTGIMSTSCQVVAVVPADQDTRAAQAFAAAEGELRDVEAKMSTYIQGSEMWLLNTATAGELVPLSPTAVEVLNAAAEGHRQTAGAFDVTIRPVIEQWKQAAQTGRLPSPAQLADARAASSWEQIEIMPNGAIKTSETVTVDLGGIAKGYGIDRAVKAMQRRGISAGLVDVGGDLRAFGRRPGGGPWRIGIRSPFDKGQMLGSLGVTDAAVCTSGNYERYSIIEGRRYSHIIDPHTARPVEIAPSVTVVAPTATEADTWATALSVLGTNGLELVEAHDDIEALLIVGDPNNWHPIATSGFEDLLLTPLTPPSAAASAN